MRRMLRPNDGSQPSPARASLDGEALPLTTRRLQSLEGGGLGGAGWEQRRGSAPDLDQSPPPAVVEVGLVALAQQAVAYPVYVGHAPLYLCAELPCQHRHVLAEQVTVGQLPGLPPERQPLLELGQQAGRDLAADVLQAGDPVQVAERHPYAETADAVAHVLRPDHGRC